MPKTLRRALSLLVLGTLIAGCATPAPVPLAVSCPPSPPVPQVLLSQPSTEPPLIEQYQISIEKFRKALQEAIRQ